MTVQMRAERRKLQGAHQAGEGGRGRDGKEGGISRRETRGRRARAMTSVHTGTCS
jgi:hypothetical protein